MEKRDLHLILTKEEHKRIRRLAAEEEITMKEVLLRGLAKVEQQKLNLSTEGESNYGELDSRYS